jgi:hypothetical protein
MIDIGARTSDAASQSQFHSLTPRLPYAIPIGSPQAQEFRVIKPSSTGWQAPRIPTLFRRLIIQKPASRTCRSWFYQLGLSCSSMSASRAACQRPSCIWRRESNFNTLAYSVSARHSVALPSNMPWRCKYGTNLAKSGTLGTWCSRTRDDWFLQGGPICMSRLGRLCRCMHGFQ